MKIEKLCRALMFATFLLSFSLPAAGQIARPYVRFGLTNEMVNGSSSGVTAEQCKVETSTNSSFSDTQDTPDYQYLSVTRVKGYDNYFEMVNGVNPSAMYYSSALFGKWYSKTYYHFMGAYNTFSPDAYVGFKMTVAPGYKLDLTKVLGSIASSKEGCCFKVQIERNNGTVIRELKAANDYKVTSTKVFGSISRINNNSVDGDLSGYPELKNLTGTIYVKLYIHDNNSSAKDWYFCLPKLRFDGVISEKESDYYFQAISATDVTAKKMEEVADRLYSVAYSMPGATSGWPNYKCVWKTTDMLDLDHSNRTSGVMAEILSSDNGQPIGYSAGANGTISYHVYSENADRFYDLRFTPDGYGVMWGSDANFAGAQTNALQPTSNANILETDVVSVEAAKRNFYLAVGLKSGETYIHTDANAPDATYDGQSNTVRVNAVPSSVSVSGTINDFAGNYGVFQINKSSTAANWGLTFIPYWGIVHHSNYPSGTDTESYSTDCIRHGGTGTLTVAASPQTPVGYSFLGWATTADGAVSKQPGQTLTIGSAITADQHLYARWTPNTSNITLLGNGHGDKDGSAVYTYSQSAATSFKGVTPKTDCVIEGYYTMAIGGTKILKVDGTLAASDIEVSGTHWVTGGNWTLDQSSVTLYAHYSSVAEICLTLGKGCNLNGSTKSILAGNATVSYSGLNMDTNFSAFTAGSHAVLVSCQNGIKRVSVTAWYNDKAESHLYAQYSEDGFTWTSMEWVVLSTTHASHSLAVPAGTKHVRITRSRDNKVYMSEICVGEGTTANDAPVFTWNPAPVDGQAGNTGAIGATYKVGTAAAQTVTEWYSTVDSIADITGSAPTYTLNYKKAGFTTVMPVATVNYTVNGAAETHKFIGSMVTIQVTEAGACYERVMMWKEANLYSGTQVGRYSYMYRPADHYSSNFTLDFFQGLGVSATNRDRAMEWEGSAFTTGKYAGCGWLFSAVGSANFTKIQFFGKQESGAAFEYTTNGTDWKDYVTGKDKTTGDSILTGAEGKDAVHTIIFGSAVTKFGIRNKGTSGNSHKGMWIRNMAIMVCGGVEDCSAPVIASQSPALTVLSGSDDLNLNVTVAAETGYTYTYKWYRCNFQGCDAVLVPGQTAATFHIDASNLTTSNTQYFICHVQKQKDGVVCGSVTHSRAFAVTKHPDNPLIRWNLEPSSTLGSTVRTLSIETSATSHITNSTGMTPTGISTAPSNNGFVGAMTPRISIPGDHYTADSYQEFTFALEAGMSLTVSEILMEIQPISYESQMFRVVLFDDQGHELEGTLQRAAPGVGNMVNFVYDNTVKFQGQLRMRLYAWDPAATSGRTYRLGTRVSIYGEVTDKPAPELEWVFPPHMADNGSRFTILAETNSTNAITYSSSNPGIAAVDPVTGVVTCYGAGTVTLSATVAGDGITSKAGSSTTISRTIVISPVVDETCTTPSIVITATSGLTTVNGYTSVTMCACDYPAGWVLTSTDEGAIDGASATEHRMIQWFDGSNEVAIQDNLLTEATALSYHPTHGGTYRSVITRYDAANALRAKQTTELSVQVNLVEAPNKPTISGHNQVEQTQSVTLTAQSSGSTSIKWYHQEPSGSLNTASSIATGSSYTFATTSATPIGRHYFYCIGVNDNPAGCTESVISTAYAVDVTAATGCDWHYLLSGEDASSNYVSTCSHLTLTSGGASVPFDVAVTNVNTALEGRAFAMTRATAAVSPTITMQITPNHGGLIYIYARGAADWNYAKTGDAKATKYASTTADAWKLITINADGGASGTTYTITTTAPVQIAIMAARMCQSLSDDNPVPTLEVLNNGNCGSVNLRLSAYASAATAIKLCHFNADGTVAEADFTGFASSSTADLTMAVSASGAYWAKVTTASGSVSSATRDVTIGAAPTKGADINDFDGYQGRTYTLASNLTGADSYQWYVKATENEDKASRTASGGVPVTGEINASTTRTILATYPVGTKFYFYCEGTNSCGTTTTNVFCITVAAENLTDCADDAGNVEGRFFRLITPIWEDGKGYKLDNENSLKIEAMPGYLIESVTYKASSTSSTQTYVWGTIAKDASSVSVWNLASDADGSTEHTLNSTSLGESCNALWFCRNSDDKGTASDTRYIKSLCVTVKKNETCTDPALAFSAASASIAFDEVSPAYPTLSNPHNVYVTYSSSDPTVATINEDGTITRVAVGTTVITATASEQLLGDATYCEDIASYTLTLPAGTPEFTTNLSVADDNAIIDCDTRKTAVLTVTNTGVNAAGATFVWYCNDKVISGATTDNYTAQTPGVYKVLVTANGYNQWTNSIEIRRSTRPSVEKLSPFQYYRNGCAYTASTDFSLRHLFKVTSYGSTPWQVTAHRYGSDNRLFDNAATLQFVKADQTDPSMVMLDLKALARVNDQTNVLQEGDSIVITVAPSNACDGFDAVYADSITVYVVAKDRRSLAYIVSGGNKSQTILGGNFLTGYNPYDLMMLNGYGSWAMQSDPLYDQLNNIYDVTPVNAFAYSDLSGTKRYMYDPFDLVILTDFPKTGVVIDGNSSSDYLNALANLVDYRPMLLLKAHIAQLPAWVTKGFTAKPYVPFSEEEAAKAEKQFQAVCYHHRLFQMLPEALRPSSSKPNVVITDTYGYDNNKVLQGFRLRDVDGMVTLGTICNDNRTSYTGNTENRINEPLATCVERQTNLSARMVMLAINAHAMPRINNSGEQFIKTILDYLLISDERLLGDCSYEFDDKAGTHIWSDAKNWAPNYDAVPPAGANVYIKKECKVDGKTAEVSKVTLLSGGKIQIQPNGALLSLGLVGQGDKLTQQTISDASRLTILSETAAADKGKNGALVHYDPAGKTKATVHFYCKGNSDDGGATNNWQWMTTPFGDEKDMHKSYPGAFFCHWLNDSKTWDDMFYQDVMTAFDGYIITTDSLKARDYTITGSLASTSDRTITFNYVSNRNYLIGNSWSAPILISAFKDADFRNLQRTIVIFNTGYNETGEHTASGVNVTTAGQYTVVPIHQAENFKTIPSMQAFQVKALKKSVAAQAADYDNTTTASITLNYNRLVRDNYLRNEASHAPHRIASPFKTQPTEHSANTGRMILTVSGQHYSDVLYLFSNPDCTMDFDNGWDGYKVAGESQTPQLYAVGESSTWAVSSQPELLGTVVGFRPGVDSIYTIHIAYEGDETLCLFDIATGQYTTINGEAQYQFTATDAEATSRFLLTTPPDNPTSINDGTVGHLQRDIRKLIIDDKVFILIDGQLYDMCGRRIK